MIKKQKLPELLAPAGDFDALVADLLGGADAVYLGGMPCSRYGIALRNGRDTRGGQPYQPYAHTRIYLCCIARPCFRRHCRRGNAPFARRYLRLTRLLPPRSEYGGGALRIRHNLRLAH